MIKAVVFDLDGTLLDTVYSMALAGNCMLEYMGLEPQEEQMYKYFAGNGAEKLVERALAAANSYNSQNYEKGCKIYREFFAKTCTERVAPYPGIAETLDWLKSNGIKTAVLSNKPHEQTKKVVEKYFKNSFDFVQGQMEEVPRKPDITGVNVIMKSFGVSKTECIYVGDTDVDMQTGSSAGIYTLGALWGFRDEKELLDNNADKIIKSPLEIIDIIKQKNG